jgi:hypothetical protein
MTHILDGKKLLVIPFTYFLSLTGFLGQKESRMNQVIEVKDAGFAEFRRKIRAAEVLSAAMERLLAEIQFNGKVSVVILNGRVLKSGYKEGYFRNRS